MQQDDIGLIQVKVNARLFKVLRQQQPYSTERLTLCAQSDIHVDTGYAVQPYMCVPFNNTHMSCLLLHVMCYLTGIMVRGSGDWANEDMMLIR